MKDEEKEKVINAGAFHYDAGKIANILNRPTAEIEKALIDPKSEISKLYKKGMDLADYAIDMKLFEMAKAGDLKALTEFEYRKKHRK